KQANRCAAMSLASAHYRNRLSAEQQVGHPSLGEPDRGSRGQRQAQGPGKEIEIRKGGQPPE
ncbi:MAG: hypothetical protein L5657_08290, partial [Calditerricola sp.]|nr:hypothetical protein [Calditerricola sp.]